MSSAVLEKTVFVSSPLRGNPTSVRDEKVELPTIDLSYVEKQLSAEAQRETNALWVKFFGEIREPHTQATCIAGGCMNNG